jgi:serine protease inhibitor ecotin
VFKSVDEFGQVLTGDYDSQRYRDWVLDNYHIDKMTSSISTVMDEVRAIPVKAEIVAEPMAIDQAFTI